MNEHKEKARSGAPTPERETEQINTDNAFSVPEINSITCMKKPQSFLDYLPHDPDKAVTARELSDWLGISPRYVTRQIQAVRKAGISVCASCGEPLGYFITDDPVILARYIKTLEGRLREIHATLTALTRTLDTMTGQQRIDDF